MEITLKFLEELEKKIKQLKRSIRRKEILAEVGNILKLDVPSPINKQIDYTITQIDRQVIEQDVTTKEQELRDKIKEIEEVQKI